MTDSNHSLSVDCRHPLAQSFTLEDFADVSISHSPESPESSSTFNALTSKSSDHKNNNSCGKLKYSHYRKLCQSWTIM